MKLHLALSATLVLVITSLAQAEPIRLATDPALSPDGQTLVFAWRGDVWSAPTAGGVARPLTLDPKADGEPEFSPDGTQLAFVSDRTGSRQVYVMPAAGGVPTQLTYHTAGYNLRGWHPDGQSLLAIGQRDHFWRRPERLLRIPRGERGAEQVVFDDYAADPALSLDGKKILFVREGEAWWRKGYHGSQAAQIWLYDTDAKTFAKLLDHPRGNRWPLWRPDGKGFYYVSGQSGTLNLWECELETKAVKQLTSYEDDSVVFPTLSRDGKTLVFRRLFDLFRYQPGGEPPVKIELTCSVDENTDQQLRRTISQATDVAFSQDGLEIAFVAGGDLWVMDTELREPRQITFTPEEERDPVFSPSGDAILFASDAGGQCDLWRAERSEADKFWWQNGTFKLQKLTEDAEVEQNLKWSPDGSRVAFVKGQGDIWTMDKEGKDPKRWLAMRETPQFDWSPDGKWLVYAVGDDDYNRDIWVAPLDNSRPPFNLSRHPDNDGEPVWSPDGRTIAFTGRRVDREVDIYLIYLRAEDYETGSRDRKLEAALDKLNKARKKGPRPGGPGPTGTPPPSKPVEVTIDFDRIHERIRRVSIPDSSESNLLWSPDSKKLAFTGIVEGKRGTYSIDLPDNLKPQSLATQTGASPRWLAEGNQIVWLVNGVPASLAVSGGKATDYRFAAAHQVERAARHRAAFDLCWRTMRDRYYDARLGNKNWDAIRRKYADAAADSPDETQFATVVSLMLGELNGSHLGFAPFRAPNPGAQIAPGTLADEPSRPRLPGGTGFDDPFFDYPWSRPAGGTYLDPSEPPDPPEPPPPAPPTEWTPVTAHLGLRFDPEYKGPGLKVRDVILEGPASLKKSRIEPGEIVLSIDGTPVDPALDLTKLLNGPLARDVRLSVRNAQGADRQVVLRPISYQAATALLYSQWTADMQKKVDQASGGTLGYLHIRAMNDASFVQFERDLYAAGSGKEGLIIDVRENGGGSTADHLLTALTQPVHAVTLGRAGGPGYPQDRKVYATWNKPIVVLCNQNSFSNAEIFSHAIKTLKRGKLVGVPTAGGVISTGAARIMDLGTLRLPGRGWYVIDSGEDMELNGAVPDVVVWPEPGQVPKGEDVQLAKGVETLLADVKAWKERPQPKLRKASER